jgi:hypothetical protein
MIIVIYMNRTDFAGNRVSREWFRIMRKPYNTQKHGVKKHNLLTESWLHGNSVDMLSGSKTRKRVYSETI